jgi:hypothetical protein
LRSEFRQFVLWSCGICINSFDTEDPSLYSRLHGVTSKKTEFFTVTALRTSNLTSFWHCRVSVFVFSWSCIFTVTSSSGRGYFHILRVSLVMAPYGF